MERAACARGHRAGETLEALWEQHLETLPLNGKDADAAVQARKLFDWHLANLEFANACECATARELSLQSRVSLHRQVRRVCSHM